MKNFDKLNYNLLLIANSIIALAVGVLGPFYFLFVQDFGGGSTLQTYGVSIGVLFLAQALFVFIIGRFSDRIGRRLFLISSAVLMAFITIMYLFISEPLHLYILQVGNGFVVAVWQLMEIVVLGDVTDSKSRGYEVGKYKGIVGVVSAFSLIVGALIIGSFGYEVIFWIVGILQLGAASVLFLMIET